MRLRSHRRNLVLRSSSGSPAYRYGAPKFARLARTGRIHRPPIRTGTLLAVVGLMRLARAVRTRWRPLLSLAAGVLTVAGVMRASAVIFIPGLLLLLVALLVPSDSSTAFVYCIGGPAQLVRNAARGGHAKRAGQSLVR